MRVSFVFLLFIFYLTAIQAQEAQSVRSLEWLTPTVANTIGDKAVLRFKNAVYNESSLPEYFELIPVPTNSHNSCVSIINPQFKQVDSLEKIILSTVLLDTAVNVRSETGTAREQNFLQLSFVPLRRNPMTGEPEKLTSFKILVSGNQLSLKSANIQSRVYSPHSVLSSGKWLKVKVENSGIYKLSYNQLKNLGFSNPANIRIYGNGGAMLPISNSTPRIDDLEEIPLRFIESTSGVFASGDFLLFYVPGIVSWTYNTKERFYYHQLHKFSYFTYCFITESLGPADEIPVMNASAAIPDHNINTFDDHFYHELDEYNLIKSGSEWYGEIFDLNNSYDFPFIVPDLSISDSVRICVRLAGRYSDNTSFSIQLNGNPFPTVGIAGVPLYSGTDDYASIGILKAGTIVNSENLLLNIVYNNTGLQGAEGWLDFIDLNVRRTLNMSSDELPFRNSKLIGPGLNGRYIINNGSGSTRLWDITNMHYPFEIPLTVVGQQAQFTAATDSIHEYIAFNPDANFPAPLTDGDDVGWLTENQDLHSLEGADLVIVTHPDFLQQAEQLAQLHRNQDNMNVILATTSQIYNEFSSGAPDVSAVRDFVKMIYDRGKVSGHLPSYLQLFGDGSFDNKSNILNNPKFILTYQSPNSLTQNVSFVTDDFYGLLDDNEGGYNGLLDIGIGRLTVKDTIEANAVVQKIKEYTDPLNRKDWRNVITFIGDDGDGNLHMGQADDLATYLETNYTGFEIEKIYLDAYQQVTSSTGQSYPDVEQAIQQRIKKGGLIINYTGHGNEIGLSHEKVFQDNTIQSLDNKERLPLFVTATCEFSRFDDVTINSLTKYDDATSAGEHILLNPNGGGIALLSTTRLVYSGPNFVLNDKFYQFAFIRDNQGNRYKLGDLLRLTKNAAGPGTNKLNFTLLGDPALTLAYPEFKILTDSINQVSISQFKDTLKAYSLVTIKGHLEDNTGMVYSNFNGSVFPVVFDKATKITTLNNFGTGAFNFQTFNSVLFRGQASVQNGNFSFSFIMPKDIDFSVGPGKIIYYANSKEGDAHGFQEGIQIGGILNDPPIDIEGPTLLLYMNDSTFRNGGITDENPSLLALISDASGINTTGTGIGHDITISLDGGDKIYANDFYQTFSDSYSKGVLKYPFSQLSVGAHQIDIKVWDSYNNSSEGSLDFVVVSSGKLILTDLINFPNPFTTETWFQFKHNRPGENLTVRIDIFSTSGQSERSIETVLNTDGYGSPSISWNGSDFRGQPLGPGIYIYRVTVTTLTGEITQKGGKLMLVR
jgi:hypothetical protein